MCLSWLAASYPVPLLQYDITKTIYTGQNTDIHSACQETHCLLRKPNTRYSLHKSWKRMIVFTLKLNFKHKQHTSHSFCWPVGSKRRDATPAQLTGYRRQLTRKHECTKHVCTSDNKHKHKKMKYKKNGLDSHLRTRFLSTKPSISAVSNGMWPHMSLKV
jgi:hypothetical protein